MASALTPGARVRTLGPVTVWSDHPFAAVSTDLSLAFLLVATRARSASPVRLNPHTDGRADTAAERQAYLRFWRSFSRRASSVDSSCWCRLQLSLCVAPGGDLVGEV